jgi:hypothetical protein
VIPSPILVPPPQDLFLLVRVSVSAVDFPVTSITLSRFYWIFSLLFVSSMQSPFPLDFPTADPFSHLDFVAGLRFIFVPSLSRAEFLHRCFLRSARLALVFGCSVFFDSPVHLLSSFLRWDFVPAACSILFSRGKGAARFASALIFVRVQGVGQRFPHSPPRHRSSPLSFSFPSPGLSFVLSRAIQFLSIFQCRFSRRSAAGAKSSFLVVRLRLSPGEPR